MLTEPRLIATILAGLAVLAGVIWYFARRSDPNRRTTHSGDRLDTVADWPPTATRILTTPERHAHEVLLRALPEYLVFAQVPLARFLKVPTRNSYTEWLRRLGTQCADLVVCDKATRKRRIAAGAGVHVQEVNRLLNQFEQMRDMMKKMKGGGMMKMMKRMGAMKGMGGPGGMR